MAMKPIKIKHPGAFRKQLGIKKGEKIPMKDIDEALHSPSAKTRKRAVFAKNARSWNKG